MNHKSKFLFVSFGFLILSMVFFLWIEQQYAAPTPVPSVPGGYYEESFLLQFIFPKDGRVYFSTDGSIPTTHSQLYVDGIKIYDRSEEPNVYNSIRNVVKEWKNYQPDETPVPKGTVVRAIYVNPWGIKSDVITQTYFVGIQPPEKGYTLSLVFEDASLFGENGIYVTGKAYDQWYLSESPVADKPTRNFNKKLETEVTAELMDLRNDILNQSVGIRIQGDSNREYPKKRFALFSREEYSGSNVFDSSLFNRISTHSVMLKNSLTDAVIAELVSDRSVATQQSIPVRLYLNGEYWYDCFMLERYDEQYFRQHYGVDDRILVKDGIIDKEFSETAYANLYEEFLNWSKLSDFSVDQEWENLQQKADMQSYIDYIVINYLICNIDFSETKNCILWRSPKSGNTQYEDMRWRWCLYDIDSIAWADHHFEVEYTFEINIFSDALPFVDVNVNDNALYRAFHTSPKFRQQFVLSFMDILNNNFAPATVEPVLQKYGYTLDWMDGYFLERPKYAVQHLAEEFDLTGTLETVSVSTSTPEMGSVTINTSTIDLSDRSWSGQYFTDYPITITAVPNPGYRFVGWQGSVQDTSGSLILPVDGGLTLEAVFAPI